MIFGSKVELLRGVFYVSQKDNEYHGFLGLFIIIAADYSRLFMKIHDYWWLMMIDNKW